jgi:uncharacterized membrane protein
MWTLVVARLFNFLLFYFNFKVNQLIKLGKWFFILPFFGFGFLHFGPLEFSLPYVPKWLPFPSFWVYFVGLCFMLFVVSVMLQKWDKLAAVLLGVCLLLFVVLIHIPTAMSGNFMGVIAVLRDIAMAGAAWMYASTMAKDNSFIG